MSSGFQSTFGKDESDSNQEFDDTAFTYFSIAMLTIFTLPLTYYFILLPMWYGEKVI